MSADRFPPHPGPSPRRTTTPPARPVRERHGRRRGGDLGAEPSGVIGVDGGIPLTVRGPEVSRAPPSGTPWSMGRRTWEPSGSSSVRCRTAEIADHVPSGVRARTVSARGPWAPTPRPLDLAVSLLPASGWSTRTPPARCGRSAGRSVARGRVTGRGPLTRALVTTVDLDVTGTPTLPRWRAPGPAGEVADWAESQRPGLRIDEWTHTPRGIATSQHTPSGGVPVERREHTEHRHEPELKIVPNH
ncbi:dihydrofolate reductase [Kocuria rhizophila]|nr:dihydrofolate reductase [Kocuria rhizophila]